VSNKTMGANIKLANAMSTTAKTMTDTNKIMKPEQVAADMRAFSQASTKMDMTDEMSKYNLKLSDSMTHTSQSHTKICNSGCLFIILQIQVYLLLCP
jgi:glutaredoxin 2